MITLIWVDAAPRVFGITGKLTDTQFQILYEAIGKDYCSREQGRVEIILGISTREGYGDDTFYDQQIEHIIDSDRMVNLDDTNWPQYRVNTFTYIVG